MAEECDVLVVGAGTAGCYFAREVARRGHSVILLERDERNQVGKRLDIFHIDSIRFRQFGIEEPTEGSAELIAIHPEGLCLSPDGKIAKPVKYSFHVMRLTPFIQRLQREAEAAGALLVDNCEFKEPLLEGGRLSGVRAFSAGESVEYRARLVVDASGTTAAVRTSLPPDFGVETFALGPGDVMFTVLRYIRWKDPQSPHPRGLNFWPFYKVFCNPSYTEEEAILGVGQPESFQRSEEVLEEFLSKVILPPFEIIKIERGITPYRRPPLSLVGEGFLCLGDAACITKPFSGEGVTAAWTLCQIAAEEVHVALKHPGPLGRRSLWNVNVRYFQDQGAKFAELLAQIPGAAGLTSDEQQYLFRKDIIFSSQELEEINRDYGLRVSFSGMARMGALLVWGVLSRQFSLKNLRSLLGSIAISGKIAKHYRSYPRTPEGFSAWEKRAKGLWSRAGF